MRPTGFGRGRNRRIENGAILKFMPQTYIPVLADLLKFGYGPVSGNSMPLNAGQFVYSNALYMVLQTNSIVAGVLPAIEILKSTDSGNTWSVLDPLNQPTTTAADGPYGIASVIFDGNQTVTVCFGNALVSPTPLMLQDFSLATETWGATYGAGGAPLATNLYQLLKRSTGDLVLLYGGTDPFHAAVFSGGAWVADVDLTTNIPAGFAFAGFSSSVVDSTDLIHVFYEASNFPLTELVYQQFTALNALGNFVSPVIDSASYIPGYTPQPAIDGNYLLYGVLQPGGAHADYATLLIGTPLFNPVFSLLLFPGIDPDLQALPDSPASSPWLYAAGTQIVAVYVVQNPGGQIHAIRVCSTLSLSDPTQGWVAATVFDFLASAPPGFYTGPGQQIIRPTIGNSYHGQALITAEAYTADPFAGGVDARFWFGNFSPYPMPAGGGGAGAAGGGFGGGFGAGMGPGAGMGAGMFASGARFKCCTEGHTFQAARMAEIVRQQLKRRSDWPYAHLFPPEASIPVEQIQDIPSPVVNTITAVLQYQRAFGVPAVPIGYSLRRGSWHIFPWGCAIHSRPERTDPECPRRHCPGATKHSCSARISFSGALVASPTGL